MTWLYEFKNFKNKLSIKIMSSVIMILQNTAEPQSTDQHRKKKLNKHYLNREIYDLYIRRDFNGCLSLVKNYETSSESKKTEFHIYMTGLINRQTAMFDKSLSCFKHCHMMNKLNFEYLKEISKSLFITKKYKGALDAAKDAIKLNIDLQILCLIGSIELALGNSVEAMSNFEKAIEVEPNDQAYIRLAEIHLKMGREQKAYSVLQEGFKYSFENSEITNMMGIIASTTLKNNEAENHFERSLNVNPREARALLALGCILQEKGEVEEAMAKYRTMNSVSPNSAQMWNNVGLCLMSKQKNLASYCCLRKAVFLDPFEWKPIANLGIVCLKMQKYSLACVNFSSALSFNPKNTELLMLLGISLAALRDFVNSELSFQEGINIQRSNTKYSNSPSIYVNYFLMLLKKGDKTSAEKVLQQAQRRFNKEIGAQKIQILRQKLR